METKKETIYVVGHKKPDTDSVLSAITYAHLKNETDKKYKFVPIIADNVNPETSYILEKQRIEKPKIMKHLKTQVADVMQTEFPTVSTKDLLLTAAKLMKENKMSGIAAVDDRGNYDGMITLFGLAEVLLEEMYLQENAKAVNLHFTVSEKLESVPAIHNEAILSEVADEIRNARSMLPVVNKDNKIVGMISRGSLSQKAGKKLIIVDHNEKSQAIDGFDECDIIEIIDHHNKSDLMTKKPIYCRQEPIGCTCTLIGKLYKEKNVEIPEKIAKLLISAIISDTLFLKSSTTTDEDRKMIEDLNNIAKLDLQGFAYEIFAAKSEVASKSAEEILSNDKKEFKVTDKKMAIAQIETVSIHALLTRKEELLTAMKQEMEKSGLEAFFLMLTDIIAEGSTIVAVAKSQKYLDKLGLKNNEMFMSGVMSRKSDFLPKVYELFS